MRVLAVVVALALMAGVCAADESVWDDWYGIMELQAGALWSFENDEFMPYFAIPTVGYRKAALVIGGEFDLSEVDNGLTAGIVGVTFYIGSFKDFGLNIPGTEQLGINVGPVYRYDFGTGETEFAVVASLIDLSFDHGNAAKQKRRGEVDKLAAIEEEDESWGSIKAMYR